MFTFGCRLYLRLLPVVARSVPLFPDSGPEAIIFGESSNFAVPLECGAVGSVVTG